MLYTQTVSLVTLGLLKELMAVPELSDFVLVGGTNLSLQLGYRLSIDIDLFTNQPFNVLKVKEAISQHFDDAIKA
jgi:hypothetical protein